MARAIGSGDGLAAARTMGSGDASGDGSGDGSEDGSGDGPRKCGRFLRTIFS